MKLTRKDIVAALRRGTVAKLQDQRRVLSERLNKLVDKCRNPFDKKVAAEEKRLRRGARFRKFLAADPEAVIGLTEQHAASGVVIISMYASHTEKKTLTLTAKEKSATAAAQKQCNDIREQMDEIERAINTARSDDLIDGIISECLLQEDPVLQAFVDKLQERLDAVFASLDVSP